MGEDYVIIKKGWADAGKVGRFLGFVYDTKQQLKYYGKGQRWAAVLWQGEEDPDFIKEAAISYVHKDKLAEELMKIKVGDEE